MIELLERKSAKDIEDMNHTINQQDVIDIDKALHPTTIEYIFFSSTH